MFAYRAAPRVDAAIGEFDKAARAVRQPEILFLSAAALRRQGGADKGVERLLGSCRLHHRSRAASVKPAQPNNLRRGS